ncbi:MAG TPA: hypothetical protein VFX48_00020 [Saprospiraceae bacterium]|nr:hypothetical protein [Saprospiraceae bacterium]
MLGNILILLTILFLIGLVSVSASPLPSGDRGVGAAFMFFICGIGFAILSGLLTWNMSSNQCFDWVNLKGLDRGWWILLGWLAFASATFASAMFRMEWHAGEFPIFLRWLAQSYSVIWLPLLMLIPALILLNGERQAGLAPGYVKFPMIVGFSLSLVIGVTLVLGLLRGSIQQSAAKAEYYKNQNDDLRSQHLSQIAEHKTSDPIINMLPFTGRFHDSDIRDSAIAKVKSHPDWEAEMIRLLSETEWYSEVYQFIDGNKVDHPELFVEPIKKSILQMADQIRSTIKNANNLQDWHFEHFSLDRLFRAIDEQFSLPGADYRPAVMELRKALDTPKPERFKDVKFNVTKKVDDWLKKHS